MKIFLTALVIFLFFNSANSYSQLLPEKLNFKTLNQSEKKTMKINSGASSSGASAGFNLGVAIIEGQVGFAIGAFAEMTAGTISFVPQANYWNAENQSNFELAGLARFYIGKTVVLPYIDGGLGINFYNSDNTDFTKLSLIIGGGVELGDVSKSFDLLFDGKYKLIVNDGGNLSCFIFTAGMKFPFK